MLTREYLLQILVYDPESGELRWRVPKTMGRRRAESCKEYRYINIDGEKYRAHQVIWMMQTGEWPSQIDHKNTIKSDNKWANLRIATQSQNQFNCHVRKHSTVGIKGVSFEKRSGNWYARIRHNGKQRNLGTYSTIEEAKELYDLAASMIAGEFARA